jgi:hypothetical protein
MKLNLKNTTLVCLECVDLSRAIRAVDKCLDVADFHDVKLFQSFYRDKSNYIFPVTDLEQYSKFMLKNLNYHINSEFALVVQYDGFIVEPNSWTDKFFKYDYIGAPWWYDDNNVGNGGFSLRSKKLLEECSKFDFGDTCFPEDDVLCRAFRKDFEAKGIKWAPENIAAQFSWEGNIKYPVYGGSFGFHGKSVLAHMMLTHMI